MPSEGYTSADYLLLDVIDVLREANWQRACINVKKGDRPAYPKPMPRPGASKRKSVVTAAKLKAFIARRKSGR
jgi:hypothetical protein